MEFGKIDSDDLSGINFSLPPDSPDTLRLLSSKRSTSEPEVFVGCAKWGRKDWIGSIYPKGTKEADFLPLYAKHFNSIELNATFYKIPSARQAAEWASKVGKDFKFVPKVSSSISHIHRLKNVEERLERFLGGIAGFGKNLGPIFLMLHPGMGPKSLDSVENFVRSIPKHMRLFIELRHEDWFEDKRITDDVFALFESLGVGSVITDVSGRRDCLHSRLTIPEAFVRFVGNDLHETDYKRVDEWIMRIKGWIDAGLQRLYFFMHQNEEVHSPVMARYVIEQLNQKCGAKMNVPTFVKEGS